MPDLVRDFLASQLGVSCIVVFLVINVIMGGAAYLILLERRICAWVQDRCGPNRTGPWGLLQPAADGLKLFVKEDYIPVGADKALFILAPAFAVIPALIGFAVIPWAGELEWGGQVFEIMGTNANIGIIYLIAVASLGVYGVVLGGWATNNKFSFLGGLRASAQMVSYEIPMGLTLLCVILTAGTVRADEIVGEQLAGGYWFILQHPLTAVIFYACMLAEANRTPFDLAEAEPELVGGWHTEYSSMKWAMYFVGEYAHLIVGGAFFTVLFLGGWSVNPLGVGPDLPVRGGLGLIMLQSAVVFGKVFLMVAFAMVLRWTLPRFRFDQLMRLAWEGLIPTSLLLLLVTSLFVYMGWTGYIWIGSLLAIAIVYMVRPLMPHQADPNHKVALIGSRFSPAD